MLKKNFVSFLALVLGLSACGTASMDLGYDDASVSSDAGSTDSAPAADTYTAPDNGQSAEVEQHPQPTGCTDLDKDGVCSTAQKADCNDNDPTINPSLPETCGDGKDNNCNGQTDEGCTTPPTDHWPNWIKVIYPSSGNWTITLMDSTVPVAKPYWKWTVPCVGPAAAAEFPALNVASGTLLHLFFNVDYGTPGNYTAWYCDLNRGTGKNALDKNAVIQVFYAGKTYNFNWSDVNAIASSDGGCYAGVDILVP